MLEYQRSFGKSYMIVATEDVRQNFELHMIKNNNVIGFLPMQTVAADGKIQFWYDITGKSSIDVYIKEHPAGEILFLKIIHSLWTICKNMKEYLLYEEGISLTPETIFIGNTEENIYFCYHPFEKNELNKSLTGFIEFYLQKMSHTNQAEVKKCYDIYDRCTQDNFQLKELISYIYEIDNCCMGKEYITEPKETVATIIKDEEKRITGESLKQVYLNLKNRCIEHFAIRTRKKVEKHAPIVYKPEDELVQQSNPTVFIGSETDKILGQLKYEGQEYGENFAILKSPFRIGSSQKDVDGIINMSTVSHYHAKITMIEDTYYIEDMNSTNGTFLNGVILTYRQKVSLEKNDKIYFADVPYRFV